MYMHQNDNSPRRELDLRTSDGIVVRLLWQAATGQVSVAVQDTRGGDSFEFEVDGSQALSAFHHPYAYAPATRHSLSQTAREAGGEPWIKPGPPSQSARRS